MASGGNNWLDDGNVLKMQCEPLSILPFLQVGIRSDAGIRVNEIKTSGDLRWRKSQNDLIRRLLGYIGLILDILLNSHGTPGNRSCESRVEI